MTSSSQIIRNFDAAAPRYDQAATAQAETAARLVAWSGGGNYDHADILDIGSGTGLVAQEIYKRWPQVKLTALDSSSAMLEETRRKLPKIETCCGDAATITLTKKFDAIFCSMALHWLPQPRERVQRWQSWLKPGGRLYVALPVEGSFREWRDLCLQQGMKDGLWPLPNADLADGLAARTSQETTTIAYPSAHAFLQSMKATGAATPHPGHRPASAAKMRAVLSAAAKPFSVTYALMFLELPAQHP